MSKAKGYTPENAAVDWRDLADQLFPLEALRTEPAVHPLATVRNSI
jgi:hypothetical protein